MHTDMTAVTIESNKIVSNQVKDNQKLLELSYGGEKTNPFGQPNIFLELGISRLS